MGWDKMRHLAKLLHDRKPIPDKLAEFIADAIDGAEQAAAVAEKDEPMNNSQKAKAFTDRLGLTSPMVGRPVTVHMTPGQARLERDFGIPSRKGGYPSQSEAAEHIAENFKMSKTTAHGLLRDADRETEDDIKEMQEAIARGEWTPD